ncbi:hypothetical protein ACFE04_019088 [Oxalis oulophora]
MAKNYKKLTWKYIFGCYTSNSKTSTISITHPISGDSMKQWRLSLSDVSDLSSPLSVDDLSSSLIMTRLHAFSLAELRTITSNFSQSNLLGEGGFGKVYKGFISDKVRPCLAAQPVAVKALDVEGLQGHREWMAEIIFLGQLEHTNLVKLIGYCCEEQNRLLVYEYMPRGSLENQLFRRYSAALPWSTRMKIALEAARGLGFLHEMDKPVIFRDLKSSNILLDSDFTVKLSDFGLATDGPQGNETHVTTRVMGTQGYAAPEYIRTGHLTTMSDVYSFGVVILELLTGKRSMDHSRPGRDQNLVEWARPLLRDNKKLDRLIDPSLEGQFSYKSAQKVAELASKCLSHHAKFRPTMRDVVRILETVQGFDDFFVGPFVYIVPNEKDGKQTCRERASKIRNR